MAQQKKIVSPKEISNHIADLQLPRGHAVMLDKDGRTIGSSAPVTSQAFKKFSTYTDHHEGSLWVHGDLNDPNLTMTSTHTYSQTEKELKERYGTTDPREIVKNSDGKPTNTRYNVIDMYVDGNLSVKNSFAGPKRIVVTGDVTMQTLFESDLLVSGGKVTIDSVHDAKIQAKGNVHLRDEHQSGEIITEGDVILGEHPKVSGKRGFFHGNNYFKGSYEDKFKKPYGQSFTKPDITANHITAHGVNGNIVAKGNVDVDFVIGNVTAGGNVIMRQWGGHDSGATIRSGGNVDIQGNADQVHIIAKGWVKIEEFMQTVVVDAPKLYIPKGVEPPSSYRGKVIEIPPEQFKAFNPDAPLPEKKQAAPFPTLSANDQKAVEALRSTCGKFNTSNPNQFDLLQVTEGKATCKSYQKVMTMTTGGMR